ncbi:MAG: hypothetical protein WBA18_17630 [Terracidiphilus sp.]
MDQVRLWIWGMLLAPLLPAVIAMVWGELAREKKAVRKSRRGPSLDL